MISSNSSSKAFPLQEVRSKPVRKHFSKLPRFCEHEECRVKLSVYNMSYYCSIHEKYHTKLTDFI